MEKIIFFGLVIPIFAFVLYLGGNAIMKGMSAKNANKNDKNLKDKWAGVNDKVPVNPQYVFEDMTREEAFLMSQFWLVSILMVLDHR